MRKDRQEASNRSAEDQIVSEDLVSTRAHGVVGLSRSLRTSMGFAKGVRFNSGCVQSTFVLQLSLLFKLGRFSYFSLLAVLIVVALLVACLWFSIY